jgi:hypothetical protein
MPATTCFQDGVTYPVLQQTACVLHDPVALHPTKGVFNPDAAGGHPMIRRLLRAGECPAAWFWRGLDDRHVLQADPLDASLVIQAAASWHGLASPLGQALLRGVACSGGAQAAHVPGLVDHQEGGARVTRLLAAVIVLWLCGSGRAVDRPCRAIRPNRGGRFRPSPAACTAQPTLRRCGLAAMRGRLRPESIRDVARAATCAQATDSSPTAGLAPLEADAVSRRSG